MKRLLANYSKTSCLLSAIWQESLKSKKIQKVPFVLDYKKFSGRELKRLKDRGLLTFEREGDFFFIDLTRDGLVQAVVAEMNKTIPFDDEDVACIVVFDIPEKFQKERRFFRNFLYRCGFIPIQKSVFLSTFDNCQLISEFSELIGFSKWVRVFVGKEK